MNLEVPPCGCSLKGAPSPSCYCGVEDLLRIIRRRYSLAVLSAIGSRRRARYGTIARALPRASSSTLAQTLQALEAARLIEPTGGRGGGYRLSEPGEKLLGRLRPLLEEIQRS